MKYINIFVEKSYYTFKNVFYYIQIFIYKIRYILCLFFSLKIISYFELYILCVYDEEIVKEYDKIFK